MGPELADIEFVDNCQSVATFGEVDVLRAVANNVDTGGFQGKEKVQRRLSAKLHNTDRLARRDSCSKLQAHLELNGSK